jgi:hypothetical protein
MALCVLGNYGTSLPVNENGCGASRFNQCKATTYQASDSDHAPKMLIKALKRLDARSSAGKNDQRRNRECEPNLPCRAEEFC